MRWLLAAFVFCVTLVLPSAAQAQSLNGEVFTSLPAATITGGTCNPSGTSTFTFSVSGVATGPYTGTFTETGSVTVGPQTVELFPGQFAGAVTDFHASFQIDSPLGTVTGTKRRVGDPGPTAPFNAGGCFSGPNNTATAAQIYANALTYSANTPDGPDEGSSIAQGNYYADPPISSQTEWREYFFLSTPGPGAPATVTLSPATATNKAGEQHCVTATVRDASGNPTPGIEVVFSVSGANSAGGTKTTDANGQATFCYTGTHAGEDAIRAFADTNESGSQDAGEPAGAATKTYVAAAPATVTLSPATATNTVGTQHCVTATVKDAFGNPAAGVTVRFSVTGSTTTSGSKTTDAGGQATFCYQGPELPGADEIKAYADANKSNTQDAGEPAGSASKTWVVPVSTPLCSVSITNGGRITANNGDKGTFGGNAQVSSKGAPKGNEEYQDHGPATNINVKSIQVLAVTCSPDKKQASIYGKATINGSGSYLFKIDVKDVAEPGIGRDTYRILLSNGYDSGEHTLEAGNIQIRIG
jgi:Bacterial Ig-like domain (group 1)